MSQVHPRIVAWRNNDDLVNLRSLYTSKSAISLQKAISITISYESKCSIPHSITSTKQLTLLKLQFEKLSKGALSNIHLLRSSATMTLIRFVNGLLDPFQQSQYAIPLSVLARRIGLPSKFIELRHMGTHEGLPSLEMLEITVNEALDWLFKNYWSCVENKESEESILLKKLEKESKSVKVGELKELIKQYRRIRRNDINKIIKRGDSTEVGKEYWGLINQIKSQMKLSGFNKVLIERILSSKLKFDNLKRLYEPLIKQLVPEDEFLIQFIDDSIRILYEFEKLKNSELIKTELEYNQLKDWINLLLQYEYDDEITNQLLTVISKHSFNLSIELLKNLNITSDSLLEKKNTKLELLDNLLTKPSNDKREMSDIDDITNDLENLKKKIKLNKKETIKSFEPYKNWRPTPFGVIP